MFEVNTYQYQGPLDVLLDLIRKKHLDITKISLAKVSDEFIQYFQQAELSIEETTKFLEIVTILLRIKRKTLFPNDEQDIEDDETVLLERLFNKQYYTVLADILDEWQASSSGYFSKGNFDYLDKIDLVETKEYLKDVNLLKLSVAFNYMMSEKEEEPELLIDHHDITVVDQISWVKRNLKNRKMKLSNIMMQMPNKYSAIVTFLAILECIRTGIISILSLESNDFLIIPGNNFEGSELDE